MPFTPSSPAGHIRLRGNRYWIHVPRGRDPITKRYRYTYDSAANLEEAVRKRDELIERLAEGREPAEKATVSMLLDRWMEVADLALSTRVTHERATSSGSLGRSWATGRSASSNGEARAGTAMCRTWRAVLLAPDILLPSKDHSQMRLRRRCKPLWRKRHP